MTLSYCNLPLTVGTEIMGLNVSLSDRASIRVMRDKEYLKTGESFYPNETLKVFLIPKYYQTVFEVTCAEFTEGRCDGRKRSLKHVSYMIMPSVPCQEVIVFAAWAANVRTGVKVTVPIVLKYKKGKPPGKSLFSF